MSWKDAFTSATRDGSGNYVAGDIAIEDVVMDRVRDLLLEDAKVAEIFGSAVYVLEGPFAGSIGTAPLIYIWSSNTTEDQVPTNIGKNDVRIFIGILWRAGEVVVKEFGQPSVASIVAAVKAVLRRKKNRQLVDLHAGEEKSLAMKSRLGSVDFTEVIVDGNSGGHALMQFDWIYDVSTDLASNIIHNLET